MLIIRCKEIKRIIEHESLDETIWEKFWEKLWEKYQKIMEKRQRDEK